jgi:dihydroxy-acid dehydratase
MVLKNCGPKGYPGMAEVGNMPLPPKILKKGITDMVRISDARMSGTAYGTIVLHVSPESAIGGPLALVKNGDRIRISVKERKIDLLISESEMSKRKSAWREPSARPNRGYAKLYMDHVLQAEHGCDFDFLRKA